jgi:hypothetical protein
MTQNYTSIYIFRVLSLFLPSDAHRDWEQSDSQAAYTHTQPLDQRLAIPVIG